MRAGASRPASLVTPNILVRKGFRGSAQDHPTFKKTFSFLQASRGPLRDLSVRSPEIFPAANHREG
jgi:hypothetical protein